VRRASGALLALCLLAGCAGVAPIPADIHVPLPAVIGARAEAPAALAGGVWRVAPFTAAGPYLERAVVYSDDDGKTLQQHPYQFWLDTPARMCRDGLLEFLRSAGGARVVASADPAATFEVRGRLLAFDRLLDDAGSTARLALALELVDTDTREVRLSRRYEERQLAAANDAGGVAAAAAVALDRLYRRFLAEAGQVGVTR